MNKTLINLENINKTFVSNTAIIPAVLDCTLKVNEKDFLAITGPSGSGKSTLLNIIGLLSKFDKGNYDLNNLDIQKFNDAKKAKLRNTTFGYIFQGFELIDDLNIYDNVMLPLNYRKIDKDLKQQETEKIIKKMGLWSRRSHWPKQLSGGQQQRVAIARAMVGKPSILLADEPTGNLDKDMAEDVFSMLKDINNTGTTIIMVTHDLDLASRVKSTINMESGQIIKS